MSEQQYRVIADRDKGDNPKVHDAEPGDLLIHRSTRADALGTLVRIERPVPTERCLSTAHHAAHEWGDHDNQPGTGYWCRGFDASDELPSLPAREQIAEAIESAAAAYWEAPWSESMRNLAADRILALLQNGADR